MFEGYTKSFINDESDRPLNTKHSTNMVAKPEQLNQAMYATQRPIKNNIKFIKYNRDNQPVSIAEQENVNLNPPIDQTIRLPSGSINNSQQEGQPLNSKLSILKKRSNANLSSFIPNNPAVSFAQN